MSTFDPLGLPDNSLNNRNIGPGEPEPVATNPQDEFRRGPVLSQPAQMKKKNIIAQSFEDASREAWTSYILPTILAGAFDICQGFLGLLFRQDPGKYVSSKAKVGPIRNGSRGTWVSYGDNYDSRDVGRSKKSIQMEEVAQSRRGNVDIRVLEILEGPIKARELRDTIEEFFDIYHYVPVDRVYEWADLAGEMPHTANQWGWYDISGIQIKEDIETGKAYIYFPRVVALRREDI